MVELDVPTGPDLSQGRAWPKARETQPRYGVVGLVQGPEVGRLRSKVPGVFWPARVK